MLLCVHQVGPPCLYQDFKLSNRSFIKKRVIFENVVQNYSSNCLDKFMNQKISLIPAKMVKLKSASTSHNFSQLTNLSLRIFDHPKFLANTKPQQLSGEICKFPNHLCK